MDVTRRGVQPLLTQLALVVAAVSILICATCSWEMVTVRDTASFDGAVRPLVTNHTVVAALASSVSTEILADVEQSPEVAGSILLGTLLRTSSVHAYATSLITSEITTVAKSSRLQGTIDSLLPTLRQSLDDQVTASTPAAVTAVTVDLSSVSGDLTSELATLPVVEEFHLQSALSGLTHLHVTAVNRQTVLSLRSSYRIARVWWWLGAVVALVMMGVAFVQSRAVLRTLQHLCGWVLVVGVGGFILLDSGHPIAMDVGSQSTALSRAVFFGVTGPLRHLVLVVAVAAALGVAAVRLGSTARRWIVDRADPTREPSPVGDDVSDDLQPSAAGTTESTSVG